MKFHRTLTQIAAGGLLLAGASAQAQEKQPTAPEVDLASMVEFDGGEFTMGTSTDEEVGRYGDRWFVNEQPAHPVEVDDFRLDKFEVSVGQFALFLTYAAGDYHWRAEQPIEKVDGGYLPIEGADDEPMRLVSWQAADHYCKWAGKRLPTEAEWEYAAAGAEGREFPWGDDGRGCEAVNFFAGVSFCHDGVVEVGSLPEGATPEGVFEMGGNVAEWVADWYAHYPEDAERQTNPGGPEAGDLKVVRGGGHLSSGRWRRTRARFGAEPERGSRNIGFRCAYDQAPDDGALRGELSLPADQGREQRAHPRAPTAEAPVVVAEGLGRPGSMVVAQGEWFVLERAGGAVAGIDPDDFSLRSVVDGLDEPVDMSTDGALLYVADAGSESIVAIDPSDGQLTTLADEQPEPHQVDADSDGLAWFSGSTLRYYDFETEQITDVVTDITGPVSVHLVGSTLFYTTDGAGDEAHTTLSSVALSEGAEPTHVLDQETFGTALAPSHVLVDGSGGYLWFVMHHRNFPGSGFLCRIDFEQGSGSCPTHTPPPHRARMALVGDTLFLPIRNSVISYAWGQEQTFYEIMPWTRAGGLIASDDHVVWSDERNGRVYYQAVD